MPRSDVKAKKPALFVSCDNGQRYYVDPQKMDEPARSVQEIMSEHDDLWYIEECAKRTKLALNKINRHTPFKDADYASSENMVIHHEGTYKVSVKQLWAITYYS